MTQRPFRPASATAGGEPADAVDAAMPEADVAAQRGGGAPADSAAPAGRAGGARLVDGRYLLEERIGSGGMASVWRAHDEVLARTVAIKLLHDHLSDDVALRERFRREAVAAAKLTHPNIVGLFDTGRDADRVYLVMEYVDGATLSDVLEDLSVLEVALAAHIGERVARALGYAHQRGIVHRDVKPGNVLVGRDGLVKVTDFGIAKADTDGALTRTGSVMGTAAYVAPEQILDRPVDGRADQYALGCVVYELLTGRRPFVGATPMETAALRLRSAPLPPRALRADLPRELDAVVLRMLAREPDARYPTAAAAAAALAPFATSGTEPAAAAVAHARALAPPRPPRTLEPTPAVEAPAAGDTFLRTEGRWLGPVIALLVLAGALVAGVLLTEALSDRSVAELFAREVTPPAEPTAPPAAPAAPATPTEQVERVPVREVTAYDPQGDGEERDRELVNLFDGAPATVWTTEQYHSPALGNLKDGVGFVVGLGGRRRVTEVRLIVDTPGIAYEIRVADTVSDDPATWDVVHRVVDAPAGEAVVELEEPVSARHLLVWVVGDLQGDGDAYVAAFGEIEIDALP